MRQRQREREKELEKERKRQRQRDDALIFYKIEFFSVYMNVFVLILFSFSTFRKRRQYEQ